MGDSGFTIKPFRNGFFNSDTAGVVDLWNRSARDAHGFFPLTRTLFVEHILKSPRFKRSNLLLAFSGSQVVGMAHYDVVSEPMYEKAGTLEVLLVHPKFRGRGIGRSLLGEAVRELRLHGVSTIVGGGAWPYCPMYAGLIDGSERSGVFKENHSARKLFIENGFHEARKSFVMRRNLAEAVFPLPLVLEKKTAGCFIGTGLRRNKGTWLDKCFRVWRLCDHNLYSQNSELLSRAIFTRMDGLSDYTAIETYAVFGVNTPDDKRGHGWATINIFLLLDRIAREGACLAELHVYADNTPAVRLYEGAGFKKIHETTSYILKAE